MRSFSLRSTGAGLVIMLVAAGGCVPTRLSRFYLLTPMIEAAKASQPADRDLAVGLTSIDLPQYLDRPQIASRASDNQLNLAEFDRWAEPLRKNFTRVLDENLSFLLSTDHVVVYPKKHVTKVDYFVTVDVIRFDGSPFGGASLTARWMILDGNSRRVLEMNKSSYVQPVGANTYDALAAALSRTLEQFSRDLAAAIEAQANKDASDPQA